MAATDTSVKKKDILPLLLLEVDPEDTVDGITRFQKLVFLLQKGGINEFDEISADLTFDYEAHNYGPYSKELHNRLDYLVKENFIERHYSQTRSGNKKETYELNQDGRSKLKKFFSKADEEESFSIPSKESRIISDKYGDMPLLELLDRVYEAYPNYTTESVL